MRYANNAVKSPINLLPVLWYHLDTGFSEDVFQMTEMTRHLTFLLPRLDSNVAVQCGFVKANHGKNFFPGSVKISV